MSLIDAAYALDEQAAGRMPEPKRLLLGALALDTLVNTGDVDRDVLDAATGLKRVATGGTLDLDASGRRRAEYLADRVRAIAREQIST